MSTAPYLPGGWIAGRIAGRSEILHGGAVGVLQAAVLAAALGASFTQAIGYLVLPSIIASLLGGLLAQRSGSSSPSM